MAAKADSILILGGAGLVGFQIAKRLSTDLQPQHIIIASLYRREAREAVQTLRRLYSGTRYTAVWGDIFGAREGFGNRLQEKLAKLEDHRREEKSRSDMLEDPEFRRSTFEMLFGDVDSAYQRSEMVQLILEHKPSIVVDSVNTATGLSYQDVFTGAAQVNRGLIAARKAAKETRLDWTDGLFKDMEILMISQMVPQLVRHVMLLHRALCYVGTRIYLKIGTTGTGGMGLNIPYTHGEDKPSPVLMSKTAMGFAHTGLLFLMSRTPGSPIVKEIKPAAMIGYRDIGVHVVKDRTWQRVRSNTIPGEGSANGRLIAKQRQPVLLYKGKFEPIGDLLEIEPHPENYAVQKDHHGREQKLRMVCVNTGENGLFALGEFAAITSLDQMEFVTAEEIAEMASMEIRGYNTGKDVLQALDSTVMGPTYRAGVIRGIAMTELSRLEAEKGIPSVAIGQLGPPQLAKYLYEAFLFRSAYTSIENVLEKVDVNGNISPRNPAELSLELLRQLESNDLRDLIISIGIPILYPDGQRMYRGPTIKIPGYNRSGSHVNLSEETLNAYARRGWVDLRPAHMAFWLERFKAMRRSTFSPRVKWSSEWAIREIYRFETINIGEVVAWLFANDESIRGYRIQ